MNETVDLFTPTDVKKVRELLLEEQDGKCLVVNQKVIKGVLDHTHDSEQFVRGVISHGVNCYLGHLENNYIRHIKWQMDITLPDLLRLCADYLERPKDTRYRHPMARKKLLTTFRTLSEPRKRFVLSELGCTEGTNGKERVKCFEGFIKNNKTSFEFLQLLFEKSKGG